MKQIMIIPDLLDRAVDFLQENSQEESHDNIAECNWMEMAMILRDFALYIGVQENTLPRFRNPPEPPPLIPSKDAKQFKPIDAEWK